MDDAPQPDAAPSVLDEHTLATLDRWLTYQVWRSRAPGAQVAVGHRGRLLLSAAYGYADVERRIPMTTGHLFRIASHSKTFTATVVLRLVEHGRLGLEDPISRYLPELTEHGLGDVVVRELLEHTGGVLRDGADADFWLGTRPFPDADALRTLLGAAGKRAPGELFAYSNLGYGLLGAVIEAVTGQSYAEAVRDHVIDPLGLTDTAATHRPDRAADHAIGYSGLHAAIRRRPLPNLDTRALDAATGMTSTAADLVTYFGAHALGDDRLLTDRSKRRMQRPANPVDPAKPDGSAYGLGIDSETVGDRRLVGHGGGFPGHITRSLLDPTDGLVVSVMTNAIDGPASVLALGLVKIIDDARAHPGEPPDAATLARTGRWANDWAVIDLAVVGGRLLTLHPGDPDPVDHVDVIERDPAGVLRIASGVGSGSVGETVTFPADDTLRYGGMTLHRLDDLPDRTED